MRMSVAISSNLNRLMSQQSERQFLSSAALPSVPRKVDGPVVVSHNSGARFIRAANDAHSRASNFGYSRKKENGQIYEH